MFHVGQKVVCVRLFMDERCDPRDVAGSIKIGERYTVAATGGREPCTGVDLVESPVRFDACFDPTRHSPFYASGLFRPVVERKTDISVFTALLDPSRRKETVR